MTFVFSLYFSLLPFSLSPLPPSSPLSYCSLLHKSLRLSTRWWRWHLVRTVLSPRNQLRKRARDHPHQEFLSSVSCHTITPSHTHTHHHTHIHTITHTQAHITPSHNMQARNHAYMHHHTHTTHKHTITHNTITHNTHAQAHHHWHMRCEMLKNPFHPNLACNPIRLKDDWRYFTALQVTVAMVGLWWILLVCRMPNLAQQRK